MTVVARSLKKVLVTFQRVTTIIRIKRIIDIIQLQLSKDTVIIAELDSLVAILRKDDRA